MDNPAGITTTINVKGVDAGAWEAAKKAASKRDETMGPWVSRAITEQAYRDAGETVFPPTLEVNPGGKSANPTSLSVDQLTDMINAAAALMQGLAAVRTSTGQAIGRRTVAGVLSLVNNCRHRVAGAMPLLLDGKGAGKESANRMEIRNEKNADLNSEPLGYTNEVPSAEKTPATKRPAGRRVAA